jgi:hypothetical protein
MTRGKRLECPRIVVVQATELKFATVDEAWAAIGPVLARVIAAAILREEQGGLARPARRPRDEEPPQHTAE